MYRLVAMSEAGDTVITEHEGTYWLRTSAGVSPVEQSEADRYICYADLMEVGESYDDDRDLAAAVDAQARRFFNLHVRP